MTQPDFTYPKREKLKSKKAIERLFADGQSVSKYPLRLVFLPYPNQEQVPLQMGVSVSKRYFKKAVDRNYFKRQLREAYRLHKDILLKGVDQPYVMMFFYQSKTRLSHSEIQRKTIQLFEKFNTFIGNNPSENG